MGRWAQRQRSGGGANSPIVMISAVRTGMNNITVTYNAPVVAITFTGSVYTTDPNSETQASINQATSNSFDVVFGGDISAETDLAWTGTVANVVTNQSIAIT